MKRVIVDFTKLTPEVLELLVEKFPDGYGTDDIVSFKNAKGETIKAVEVRSEDSIYLVKISLKLEQVMEDYDEDDDMEDVFEVEKDESLFSEDAEVNEEED